MNTEVINKRIQDENIRHNNVLNDLNNRKNRKNEQHQRTLGYLRAEKERLKAYQKNETCGTNLCQKLNELINECCE